VLPFFCKTYLIYLLLKALHEMTLLDGEMIIDNVPKSGLKIRWYLIYDLMVLNSVSQTKVRWCRMVFMQYKYLSDSSALLFS
jgi:hypothetical protein